MYPVRKEAMSNSQKIKLNRNTRILLTRAHTEVQPGLNIAQVYHDSWCAGLAQQDMDACNCRPEIKIMSVR